MQSRSNAISGAAAAQRQRGFSMIEAMVAIVAMALGIMAVAGMQASGLRVSHGAQFRAQAAFLAQDMIERIRGNPGDTNNYEHDYGDPPPNGATVAERDKAQWLGALAGLPGGVGRVEVDQLNNLVRVTVRWDNSRAGNDAAETFSLSSRIGRI